ncbi:D-cysteine desulfhydrase family protein [Methylobacterium sp. A54F]
MGLDLARFPRLPLVPRPSPIEPLDGLTRALGDRLRGVRILVKRDDLAGFGLGGNKLRKLAFLLGAARAEGADTVITVGALQSNHARLTAAAAARTGFRCELFLTRTVPRTDPDYRRNGNRFLDELFGAQVHELAGDADALRHAEERAEALRAEGRRVYVFPSGGSSPTGCLGYAEVAAEILDQATEHDLDLAQVVVPNGSSGTHAGLAAGLAASGRDPRLARSYTVLAARPDALDTTLDKARATAALLRPGLTLEPSDIDIDGEHRGPAYGIPTDGMRDAVRALASSEGLLLDPVYSGKAFGGLLHDIAAGRYAPGSTVLFVMTGGVPGLFA